MLQSTLKDLIYNVSAHPIPSHPTYLITVSPSQHNPKNSPNKKSNQNHKETWDGKTLGNPIPTKNKKPLKIKHPKPTNTKN
jgi:hypothetical protein